MNLRPMFLDAGRARQRLAGGLLLAAIGFAAGLAQAAGDLAPLSVWTPTNNVVFYPSAPWSLQVPVIYGITNQGPEAFAGDWDDLVYLSTDRTTNGVISSQSFPVQNYEYAESALPPGGVYWRTNLLSLPQQSGTYWIILQANANPGCCEQTLTNNVLVSATPLTLTYQVVPPDLAPLAIMALSNQVEFLPPSPQAPSVPVVYAVTNQGLGVAAGWWSDEVCISTNDSTNGIFSVQSFPEQWDMGALPVEGVYWRTNLVSLPSQNGTYWLFFKANNQDAYLHLYEENYTNNFLAAAASVSVRYQVVPPDLAASSFVVLGDNVRSFPAWPQSPAVSVVYAVTNQGAGLAGGSWHDQVSVSTNGTADGIISSQSYGEDWSAEPLAPGAVYWRTNQVTLPQQSGTYWLLFQANADQGLYEQDPSNNGLVATTAVTLVSADLAARSIAAVSNSVTFFPTIPQPPSVAVVYAVQNEGPGTGAGSWSDRISVSTNNTTAGIISSQEFYEGWYWSPLQPGQVYWRTNLVTLPQQSGTYWLILQAGPAGHEANLSNNVMVAAIPLTLTYQVRAPDLAPVSVAAPSNTLAFFPPGPLNPTVPVTYAVTNQGPGPASGYWYDLVGISTNGTSSGIISSQRFLENWFPPGLQSGAAYWRTNLVSLPQQSGTYWLLFQANTYNLLYEANVSNNTLVATAPVTLTYQVVPPDLAPLSVAAVTNNVAFFPSSPQSPTVPVAYGVTNQGPGTAGGYWWDRVWVSTNGTSDGIVSAETFDETWNSSNLLSGGVYWRTNLVSLPQQNGTYWLIFQANGCPDLYESNYANNSMTAAAPVSVTYQVLPADLAPVLLQAPLTVTGPPGASLTVAWGVTNQGVGTATGSWSDTLFLSTNSVLDASSVKVGSFTESNSVPVGGLYWRTNTVRLPAFQSGNYFLIFSANADNRLYEPNQSNNVISVPVNFKATARPDLALLSLQAPAVVAGLSNVSLTLSWGVTNQGPGIQGPGWYDALQLWSPMLFWGWSGWTGSVYEATSLAPGQTLWRTNTFQVSVPYAGRYFLGLQTDSEGLVYEANPSNNWAGASIMMLETNDLALETYPTANPVQEMTPLTFVVEVFNAGPGLATGVRVTNLLSGGVAFVDAVLSQGSCSTNGSLLICDFGNVPGGAAVSASLRLLPLKGTRWLTVQSTLARNEIDPVPWNNLASSSVTVTPAPPPNDAFANRLPIVGLTNTITGSNEGATREPGEPAHGGADTGASSWWTWTAPANGTVTLDASGSSFAALLAVYTGQNVTNLAAVASTQNSQSSLGFVATAGTTYQIAVDGYDGAVGAIILSLQQVPSGPPAFLTTPQNQTVAAGANATFSAGAVGSAPLSYQWLFKGASLPGATAATFGLTNVQLADAGLYRVLVSNLDGTAFAQAWLNVGTRLNLRASGGLPVLDWAGPYILQSATNLSGPYLDFPTAMSPFTNRLLEPRRFFRLRSAATNRLFPAGFSDQGQFRLQASGLPGYNYVLQASTNLDQWISVLTNTVPFDIVDPDALSYPSRFYRLRLAP